MQWEFRETAAGTGPSADAGLHPQVCVTKPPARPHQSRADVAATRSCLPEGTLFSWSFCPSVHPVGHDWARREDATCQGSRDLPRPQPTCHRAVPQLPRAVLSLTRELRATQPLSPARRPLSFLGQNFLPRTQVQGRPGSFGEAQDGVGTVTCLKSHVGHSSWEHAGGMGMTHRRQQLPPAATASCLFARAPVPVLMVSRPSLALPTTKCPF